MIFVEMIPCASFSPAIAMISPSKYSCRSSAARSRARYSSTVNFRRGSECALLMVANSCGCRGVFVILYHGRAVRQGASLGAAKSAQCAKNLLTQHRSRSKMLSWQAFIADTPAPHLSSERQDHETAPGVSRWDCFPWHRNGQIGRASCRERV